jgi:deoxyadenosine/deoxycytidine kinase
MNPKFIEIIGPPGVGKSTIYQSLCRKWDSSSKWVYPEVLLTNKPSLFPIKNWMIYRMRMLLHKKLIKTVPVDYGLRFDEQQQKLARFCWKHLSDTHFYEEKEANRRFRSAYFLFSSFCLYQAIIEKGSANPCIIEEGFLQKSFFIKDNEADDQLAKSLLNEYLSLVPSPYAIIYIDAADTNEVVKRLRGRSKIIASHFGKDDEALRRDIENWRHVQDNILEKMKLTGVSIIRINGLQPVKKNVAQILKMLNNLNEIREAGENERAKASKGRLLKAIKSITSF